MPDDAVRSRLLTRMSGRRCCGSITLEAAAAMPAVLVVLLSMAMAVMGVQATTLWRSAQQKAGRVAALAGAAEPEQIRQAVDRSGLSAGGLGAGLVLSRLTGPRFHQEQRAWFWRDTDTSPEVRRLIADPKLYLEIRRQQNLTRVTSRYQIPTLIGRLSRRQSTVIPDWSVWGGLPPSGSGAQRAETDDDSIWSAGNFVRGLYFRERSDGDLPSGYPVLAAFRDGEALSVKSMDLTAPHYRNPEALRLKIMGHVRELAAFQGTAAPWGSRRIQIAGHDIRSRTLRLVIPENSPPDRLRAVELMRRDAQRQGVQLVVVRQGVSRRYAGGSADGR